MICDAFFFQILPKLQLTISIRLPSISYEIVLIDTKILKYE